MSEQTQNKPQDQGLKLPGEGIDKCCFCFPIKAGFFVIFLLMLIWAGNAVFLCFRNIDWSGDYLIYGFMYGFASAPILMGTYYFARYFSD